MHIEIRPSSLASAELVSQCRRRLAVVLSRYSDLVAEVSVRAAAPEGCAIEVVFGGGGRLEVSQPEVGGGEAVNYLVDRVGRAVARRVALTGGRADSL